MASASSCASCNISDSTKLRGLICGTHYKCMGCIMKVGNFDCEKCSKPTTTSETVYVFMDNSNIWIEAKKLGVLGGKEDRRVRVDVGTLLEIVAKERDIGDATLYGSEPPPLDTVWKEMNKRGWKVKTQPRSQFTDKEKRIDTQMVADMGKLIYTNTHDNKSIVLISGDADMIPAIDAAFEKKWKVEVYMWKHAMSYMLRKLNEQRDNNYSIYYLDDYKKQILFNSMKFPIAKNKKLLAIVRANGIVCKMDSKAFLHSKGGNPTKEWCSKVESKFNEKFRFFWMDSEFDTKNQQTVHLLVLVFTEIKASSFKIAEILKTQKKSISIQHVLELETYLDYEAKFENPSPQLQLTNKFFLFDSYCEQNFEEDDILEELGLPKEVVHVEDRSFLTPISLGYDESQIKDDSDYDSIEEYNQAKREENEDGWITVEYPRKQKLSKQRSSQLCDKGRDCPFGLDCQYRHTEEDKLAFQKRKMQSKPPNYKTRLCAMPNCSRPPDKCNFAHGEKDAISKCWEKGHLGTNCKAK